MSHSSRIVARLKLPPNPSRSPDPAIRRAYWAEVKRGEAARKHAAKQAGKSRCAHRVGAGWCEGLLEVHTDRIGRTVVTCPKCIRRERGICATCPRKIDGDPRRGASWCARCRRRHTLDRRARLAKAEPEKHAADVRRRRRLARQKLLADLRSPDPIVRAAAEERHRAAILAQRAAYARMAARRKAAGLPVSARTRKKSAARETSTRRAA